MKDKILAMLRENQNVFVSGEMLSDRLGVSRTAVWKCIRELREEGYDIEASSRKGYKLGSTEVYNAAEIQWALPTRILGKQVVYRPVLDSTNVLAKRLAMEDCPEGTVVVADTQTAGRGRLGRDWSSSPCKGIWMSVVLRPAAKPEEVNLITLAAAVAVVRALKDAAGVEAAIKWPNDVLLDGKKVCGILTEMGSEMERVHYVILGIGINVNQEAADFPPELRDKAVSLYSFCAKQGSDGRLFNRSEIVKKILFYLEDLYSTMNHGKTNDIIHAWKEHTCTLNKVVKIKDKNGCMTGTAEDITSDGRLVVRLEDGTLREILSGEISVRGLLGYS